MSQTMDANERLRVEVAAPARGRRRRSRRHEEISERIGQILKLAEDESKAPAQTAPTATSPRMRELAQQETNRLREEVKGGDGQDPRPRPRSRPERMLSAAHEQAEEYGRRRDRRSGQDPQLRQVRGRRARG